MFDDTMEDMLMHLEEFCSLMEMIRMDDRLCLQQILKTVYEKSLLLEPVYVKIEKLEKFVSVVKKCVEDMEEQMTRAEQMFPNNKIKKFFTSLMNNSSSKQVNNASKGRLTYDPPHIFNTNDFIKQTDIQIDVNNSNNDEMNAHSSASNQ